MSPRVLLGSFLVMVVLSVVAASLVAFPPAAPPAPRPLLAGFDASRVNAVHLDRDGAIQSLAPTGTGAWDCLWGSSEAPIRWPAADVRIRSGLRMLAEATLSPASGAPAAAAASTVMLEVSTLDGPTRRLTFVGESVAGRAPVTVREGDGPDESGLTDDRLHAVFARSGLLPWREDRAMPGVARDPQRLVITAPAAGGARLELSRTQGLWSLSSPVAERAESAAVQSSVQALARIAIVSFRDDAEAAQVGLEAPRVSIRVEGGRSAEAYHWQIDIGAPASADGNQVFARLSGIRGEGASATTLGPVIAVIGLDALSGVFTNPEAYLARSSLATPAPDVRRFTIKSPDGSRAWRYERTLDGWQITSPAASAPRPATAPEAAAIPAVLELLAATPPAATALREPAGFVPAAEFQVEGPGGLIAETVTIGRIPAAAAQGGPPSPPGSTAFAIRAGSVWRSYAEAVDALNSLLPIPP